MRVIGSVACYVAPRGRLLRILPAELGNDAGIIGAALLGRAL